MTIYQQGLEIPSHEIVIASSKDEIQQCFDVVSSFLSLTKRTLFKFLVQRVDVFHHEQKFPLDTEFDELVLFCFRLTWSPTDICLLSSKEDFSTHILLRLTPSLSPIGTIRGYLVPETTDTYKLTRLALLKDYRKYGFGRKLVEAFHDWVKSHASAFSVPLLEIPQNPATANNIEPNAYPISRADHDKPSQPHQPQPTRQIKVNCHSQIYAKGFYSKYVYP